MSLKEVLKKAAEDKLAADAAREPVKTEIIFRKAQEKNLFNRLFGGNDKEIVLPDDSSNSQK